MKTILILDDNKACSATVKMKLMSKGYKVSRATDAKFLINQARNDEFDLLLINYAHGNGRGWKIFNQISRMIPHLPAMVYVMDHPSASTAVWITKAVDAVIYETEHGTSRCSGLASASAGSVKRDLQMINGGREAE